MVNYMIETSIFTKNEKATITLKHLIQIAEVLQIQILFRKIERVHHA